MIRILKIRAVAHIGNRWLGVLAFAGFFLTFAAWAFAAPYDGPPDEVQHVVRAAGVVSGQIAPKPALIPDWDGKGDAGMGAYQRVPERLRSPATCWGFDRSKPASCARTIGGGRLADVPTSAGRYHPLYYLAVGAPVRLWPGWAGLVLSRLISAALSAALLAWAFVSLVRWSRKGLMLGGLLAVSTPMLAHLAGAVNPNGLEIAAGIGFFAAAIPLLLGPPERRHSSLVWLAGVSAVLLAVMRSLGPLWLLAGLAMLLIPQSRRRLRQLWQQRIVRGWSYGIAAALLFSIGWSAIMGTGEVVDPGRTHFDYTLAQASIMYFTNWGIYLDGMVGVAGWFDINMPDPFYYAWLVAAGSIVMVALAIGSKMERWRFFVVAVGAVVVPGVLQVRQANLIGFIIGGRYMLPLFAAVPLLAAFIAERLFTARQAHSLVKWFCVFMLPAHGALLLYAMMRWQRGWHSAPHLGDLNPFGGVWQPPSGTVLPVALMIVGVMGLGWMFWHSPAWAANGPPQAVSARQPEAHIATSESSSRRPPFGRHLTDAEPDSTQESTADEARRDAAQRVGAAADRRSH